MLQYSPFNCCGRRIRTSHQELALAPPQRPPAIDKAHFSVVPVGTTSVKTSGSPILSAVCAFYKIHFLLQSLSLCPLLFIQQALVNRAKGNQDLLFVSFKFTRRFCTNLRDDKIMHRHSSILCLLLASFNKMWAYA